MPHDPTHDDDHETLDRWLRARRERDTEALRALTAADAVWESPVTGTCRGRDAVVGQVAAAWRDTEDFSTETLWIEVRADRAAVMVRNSGRRGTGTLDSLQTLFIATRDGRIGQVRIAVDDPVSVEAFWSVG